MSGKRYPEDFKTEAVKQVTDRGYKISEVAQRLGITVKSRYGWIDRDGKDSGAYQAMKSQQEEIRQLEAELSRVTEERDIFKEAAECFAGECKRRTCS